MPRNEDEILRTARASIIRVIDQLNRDRLSLAGKSPFAAGEAKISAAQGAAVRLSDALKSSIPPEHP